MSPIIDLTLLRCFCLFVLFWGFWFCFCFLATTGHKAKTALVGLATGTQDPLSAANA